MKTLEELLSKGEFPISAILTHKITIREQKDIRQYIPTDVTIRKGTPVTILEYRMVTPWEGGDPADEYDYDTDLYCHIEVPNGSRGFVDPSMLKLPKGK